VPIYQTAQYQVQTDAVPAVVTAIEEFVAYLSKAEPGLVMYKAWQQLDDPTRFVHLFTFADDAAHETHGSSEAAGGSKVCTSRSSSAVQSCSPTTGSSRPTSRPDAHRSTPGPDMPGVPMARRPPASNEMMARRVGAPRDRADAGDESPEPERLDDVVIRA